MRHIARDDGKAVHQCRRGDLLVQRILRMWNPQLSPYLRDLLIEWMDRVGVITCDRAEPTSEGSRRREVTTLTLTVQSGEVFCLLGANGAAKTTTINLFLNFVQPTSVTPPEAKP